MYIKVIGVVEDFNFSSLREEIGPIIFILEKRPEDLLTIRMNPKNKEKTISYIDDLWHKMNPNEPFKYDYLEDMIDEMYESDDQLQSIIGYFAILSIFISLLGLFGLSSFITEQFSKNIGIRKLLGAFGQVDSLPSFQGFPAIDLYCLYYCHTHCLAGYEQLVREFCLPNQYPDILVYSYRFCCAADCPVDSYCTNH